VRIDYTVVFDSDWRVGSGEAAGRYLDDLVRRDGLGLPFLPGSTLRGIAGDAIQRLARALSLATCAGTALRDEEGKLGQLCGVTRPEEEICPLCVLTGSPHRPAKVRWGPARLVLEDGEGRPVWKPKVRESLARQAGRVPELLTRPHARTAIEEKSGRAEDEHLFSLEEARAGLELYGSVEIAPDVARRHVALLVGALRFVRAIGGSRRRGLGACRIRIDSAELEPHFGSWQEAVKALGQKGERSEAAKSADSSKPEREPVAPWPEPPSPGPVHVRLDARVVGEVAVGGRPEAGNLISGLPFVPGSSLRGALAALWRGKLGLGSEEFMRSFVSGRIRFGFLYPVSGQTASRPVPHSVHTCKATPGPRSKLGHGVVDLLVHPDRERCTDCGSRLIPWPVEFEGEDPRLALSPHNRIEFESQTVREGGLFAYEGLGEGTHLRGFVVGEEAADVEALLEGLGVGLDQPFRLRLGRRKGALGHIECQLGEVSQEKSGIGLFPDGAKVPESWPETDLLRVDLLTPAIVVDEHLRYRKALTPGDVGLALESFEGSFGQAEVISGWHSARGLPKADQVAITKGSSYLVRRPPEGAGEELEVLRSVAREGVGIRRVEGFGVVSVRAVEPRDLEEAQL